MTTIDMTNTASLAKECANYCQALVDHGDTYATAIKFIESKGLSAPTFSMNDNMATSKFKMTICSEIWWFDSLKRIAG